MRFWGVVDGDEALEPNARREDAERFVADVRADDEDLADSLRLEPVQLDA